MNLISTIEKTHRKPALPQVQTGDTVRVHQVIREGNKQRIQVFEGIVIRNHRPAELTANITVRRIASGVGVEKTFLLHSPNVTKIEIMRRAKVRRSFLSFLRERRGKSARLPEIAFDKAAANDVTVKPELTDADLTEIEVDATDDILNEDVISTDEVAKEESKEASEADAHADTTGSGPHDEEALKSDEVESGVAKADDEDTRAGA